VENVVYPPQNPVVSSARVSADTDVEPSAYRMMKPRMSEPVMFTMSVPTGNVPARC